MTRPVSTLQSALIASMVALSGCTPNGPTAAAPKLPTVTFLVFNPTWETSPAPAQAESEPLILGLTKNGAVQVARADKPASCAAEPTCLTQHVQASGAQKAVSVRLAGLGDTVLLRATVINGKLGTEEDTRQVTLFNVHQAGLNFMLTRLGVELAAPYAPKPQPPVPLVRSPWFWGVIALVVVGGAAAAGGAAWASQPKPDVVINPP
ncbi:MAG: hypothetical protein IPK82_14440 [Polyangiaceae bacterium]|nr:hypothetical protein [Polyangiaceae bacterium]